MESVQGLDFSCLLWAVEKFCRQQPLGTRERPFVKCFPWPLLLSFFLKKGKNSTKPFVKSGIKCSRPTKRSCVFLYRAQKYLHKGSSVIEQKRKPSQDLLGFPSTVMGHSTGKGLKYDPSFRWLCRIQGQPHGRESGCEDLQGTKKCCKCINASVNLLQEPLNKTTWNLILCVKGKILTAEWTGSSLSAGNYQKILNMS